MERKQVLDHLTHMLPSMFALLLDDLGISPGLIKGEQASQAERALQVLQYIESQDGQSSERERWQALIALITSNASPSGVGLHAVTHTPSQSSSAAIASLRKDTDRLVVGFYQVYESKRAHDFVHSLNNHYLEMLHEDMLALTREEPGVDFETIRAYVEFIKDDLQTVADDESLQRMVRRAQMECRFMEKALDDASPEALENRVRRLTRIFQVFLKEKNTELFDAAEVLREEQLPALIARVHELQEAHPVDLSDLVTALQRLGETTVTLHAKAKQHNDWQYLDSSLRNIESFLANDSGSRADQWGLFRERLEGALVDMDETAALNVRIGMEPIEDAFTDDGFDELQLAKLFARLRRAIQERFLELDKYLKKFSNTLYKDSRNIPGILG